MHALSPPPYRPGNALLRTSCHEVAPRIGTRAEQQRADADRTVVKMTRPESKCGNSRQLWLHYCRSGAMLVLCCVWVLSTRRSFECDIRLWGAAFAFACVCFTRFSLFPERASRGPLSFVCAYKLTNPQSPAPAGIGCPQMTFFFWRAGGKIPWFEASLPRCCFS
jgi:hypothetical protein